MLYLIYPQPYGSGLSGNVKVEFWRVGGDAAGATAAAVGFRAEGWELQLSAPMRSGSVFLLAQTLGNPIVDHGGSGFR